MRLNSAARAGRHRLWWASAPLLTAGVLAGLVTLSPDRDVRISLPATSLLWLVGALGSAAWLGFVLVAGQAAVAAVSAGAGTDLGASSAPSGGVVFLLKCHTTQPSIPRGTSKKWV